MLEVFIHQVFYFKLLAVTLCLIYKG